uniref:Uncharacterized protein n=1 Tax=Leptocylindrus danicus TaxID=163516 RepID=A0A7S2K6Z1_9STRA
MHPSQQQSPLERHQSPPVIIETMESLNISSHPVPIPNAGRQEQHSSPHAHRGMLPVGVAQSMPVPRAPFLRAKKDAREKLSRIPSLILTEAAIVEDDTTSLLGSSLLNGNRSGSHFDYVARSMPTYMHHSINSSGPSSFLDKWSQHGREPLDGMVSGECSNSSLHDQDACSPYQDADSKPLSTSLTVFNVLERSARTGESLGVSLSAREVESMLESKAKMEMMDYAISGGMGSSPSFNQDDELPSDGFDRGGGLQEDDDGGEPFAFEL